MQRALVVSIHDVAPVTRERVQEILGQLEHHGVSRCSLLVVPNYHHLGKSLGDHSFRTWLQESDERGHEIVIHGYYHQRPRRAQESTRRKAITRIYTADEGEFYDLEYETALSLMREAQNEFTASGLRVSGFVAPAWLLGTEAERAAQKAGFRYTTSLREVHDFASGQRFASQTLVYSVRSDWRCAVSLLWNRVLFQRLTDNRLLRLGLHPPDFDHPGIWRQITTLIGKGLRDRLPNTYQSWLDEQPATRTQRSAMV